MKTIQRNLAVLSLLLLSVGVLQAAMPPGGTLSEASPSLSWTSPVKVATAGGCGSASNASCDNFALTIVPPSSAYGPYVVTIKLLPQGDWDLEVYGTDGKIVKGSGNGAYAQETVYLFNPPGGTYTVAAAPFSPAVGPDLNSYAASATLSHQAPSGTSQPGSANIGYANFPCPNSMNCTSGFGEPSIGVNWKTGAVLFAGGGTLKTYRVTGFNDTAVPPSATWANVSGRINTTPRLYADPILFTDPITGRTLAGQEEGLTPFATVELTDDDGSTWLPSQGSGIPSGVDHETIGGGPLAAPLTRDPALSKPYPHGVYYCAQSLGPANCALSLDGGVTFGPAVTTWTFECGGLHGHVKVSPYDGTVYVPNRNCTGQTGFAYSTNNGATWTIRKVPGSTSGESDPSIGIAADGTVYLGFQDGDGHPKIAVTHDKGATWDSYPGNANFIDVGVPFNIQNSAFPAVVAGDPDRAAFAFHGTPTGGGFQASGFPGVWNLYVAHTLDGGKTWTTVKASDDPTQRGCIWMGGGSNPCRNLLDFMDASIDEAGRVVVGYADGCTGVCASDPNSTGRSVWATIARQSVGKRLFARFDPPESACVFPGKTVVTDPPGDAADQVGDHDLTALSINESGDIGSGNMMFVIKTTGLGTITPGTTWGVLFKDGATDRWVRMQTGPTSTTPVFGYGVGTNLSATGATVADYHSYFSIDGSIRIVVPKSAVATSGTLTNFQVLVRADASTAASQNLDSMPNSGSSGSYTTGGVTCTANESSCKVPGVTVIADNQSDSSNRLAEFDIRSISVAEPASIGAGKILFVLKMQGLGSLPPNTTWPVLFNVLKGSANADYFVRMQTDSNGVVSFSYGSGATVTAAGTKADSASFYSPEGTIAIVVPRSALLVNGAAAAPGDVLRNFLTRVRLEAGGSAVTPDNAPDDLTRQGSYAIRGSENCSNVVVSHFSVTAPASATAGGAFPVTVTALDDGNNVVSSYAGTVAFRSSDLAASLPASSTLTNGAGTFDVTLRTVGNQSITATDTANASIMGSTTVGVAAGSPGSLQFNSAGYSVSEGAGTATITVTRAGGSLGAATVNYATSSGTATAGSDYVPANGTLSWADGETSSKTFVVTIVDDSAVEPNETVNLTLTAPGGGATLGAPSTAVLTIVDNDSQGSCTLPGVTVQTDAAGDQTGGPSANSQLDIRSVSIAEPYFSDTEHALTFTMKVSNLSGALQPNSIWTVYFNSRDTAGVTRQFFVQMNTSDVPVTKSFTYGWHDPANNIDLGQCFANSCPVITGSSDGNGTITIKLVTTALLTFDDATGAPLFTANFANAGTVLSGLTGSTSTLAGAVGTGLILTVDSTAGDGSYTVVSNQACKPNLTADPACTVPGPVVVANSAASAGDQVPSHHILSSSVAYPYSSDTAPDQLVFTIKVASLATLTPSSFYYSSFTVDGKPEAAGNVFGVRMVVSETGAVSFESYLAGASNGGTVDGRFVASSKPAETGSSYDPAGTITIVVKPSNIGITSTDGSQTLTMFNGAVAQTAAGVVTAILDSMPSGGNTITGGAVTRGGSSFTVRSNQTCKPAQPATHYGLNAPATVQRGGAFSLTVTALDSSNARATGYRGTVHFTSTDSAAALPADYTFTFADSGVHVFTVTLNTAGTQSVTAADVINVSISGNTGVTVSATQASTTTTLMSSANPSNTGQSVTFTATVAPSGATGTVVFRDGAVQIGSGSLSAGQASMSTSALGVGTHSITAVYGGDSNYASSTSAVLTQTVNQLVVLAGSPRYDILKSPTGIGDNWGEPSIGVNWRSERTFSNSGGPIPNGGTLMSFGGFGAGSAITNLGAAALRVTCSDCPSPADVIWEKTASLIAAGSPRVYGDPILFTDRDTGRTFISQLVGLTPTAGTDYTDDDGRTIVPTQGSGVASGLDHQTIGGGPYHAPVPQGAVYQNAVYYCAQNLLNAAPANCALSVDGGVTYGPAVPVGLTGTICGGIHGHVKVAPDGTVYVPHRFCGSSGGPQGMAISTNNGLTWSFTSIDGTATGAWDPSIGVASDGTVYFGFDDGNRHPMIAVYDPKTQKWGPAKDVGTAFGIKNTAFPAVVAGDGDRAAYAFIGTPTGGSDQAADFSGVWHLYVAHTFDGGQTWTTTDLTPNDPVQRGPICAGGTSCGSSRNLLDFFDATIDQEGRVIVGYADGCVTASCINGGPNDNTSKNAIARQSGGRRMLSKYDPIEPGVPKAPGVTANLNGTSNRIFWTTPDHSGSPVTGYRVYRRTGASGAFDLLKSVTGNSYDDNNIVAGTAYAYRVTSVNAIGEGPYCGEAAPVLPPPPPDPCHTPGVMAVDDLNSDGTDNDAGQNTPPDSRVNIQRLFVAEPDFGGASKLVFTLSVKPSTVVNAAPPSSQWLILWNRPVPDTDFDRWYVAMTSDALGAVSFSYGKFGVALPIGSVPNPNTNQTFKLGDADSGTYDPATGKIVITLSTSKAENIGAGQKLAGLNVRTFFGRPDAGLRSQAVSSDITADGTYTLVGNASCGNRPPVAVNDNYSTDEDVTLTVGAPGVLANDTDADGNALTATLVSNTAHGVVSLSSDGSFTYVPFANYNGPDSFTYKASDGKADSNTATVLIAVRVVNDAPVAANDAYSTAEDTVLNVPAPGVLNNDSDVDGDSLSAALVGDAAHGTVALNANGSFTYTPAADYNGPDSFTYKASDGQSNSNVATVSITMTPVNDAPVAANDAYSTAEDTVLNVPAPGVLNNDSDVDGDSLSAALVGNAAHGTVALNANGSLTYTPAADYNGPDSFTYQTSDGQAGSNVATVRITVSEVNDPPLAVPDSATVAEDNSVTIAVLANDSAGPASESGQTLTLNAATAPSNGSAVVNPNNTITYTPVADYNGSDSFSYTACDNGTSNGSPDSKCSSTTVSITITPVNDPPAAVNDVYSVKPNGKLTVVAPGVLTNDSDVDSASLRAVLLSTVSNGTLTLNSDGSFVYTPANGFKGTDSFSYKANDSQADSNAASVTINVTSGAERAAKLTGGGEVRVTSPEGRASFGFDVTRDTADGAPYGNLSFYNNATGLSVVSTQIMTLNLSGTAGSFSGTCTKNGVPCTFTVTVEDNGEPGKGVDRFSIAVSGEAVQGGVSPIVAGNVQVH